MKGRRPRGGVVRPYVVTQGRAHPTRNILDPATLVMATRDLPLDGLNPEQYRIMALCSGGTLSVAEVASHVSLPLTVTKVLLSDLIDSGHLVSRAPISVAQLPDASLLQEVLDGLRARL
ncbi:DUF742 domain-containing protein [Streptomyces sp. NPDC005438]|uniref:DUF742 domain-containing protein n=1 Tax=Streptomyces sp. NPDC005438 TaxID=3156880 RepID=UPI0033A5F5BF